MSVSGTVIDAETKQEDTESKAPPPKRQRKSRKKEEKDEFAAPAGPSSGAHDASQHQPTAGSASPASSTSSSSRNKPVVGATNVDNLMLIIQAQNKHAEKVAKGETNEPFRIEDEHKLIPAEGTLNGGVGKRSTNTVLKYKCDFPDCNKSFSQKTHLEIHGRSHTGERPYKCDFEGCGKTFSQRGNLRTHRRSHTGEKPYTCEVCDKKFAQRGNYRAHKLIHENHRPYVCKLDNCNKTFTQLGNLKAHQNKFHTETVNSIIARLKFYGTSVHSWSMLPPEETSLLKYFSDLYKNSNRGIKGRGKDSKIAKAESSASPASKTEGDSAPASSQPPAPNTTDGQPGNGPNGTMHPQSMLGPSLFQHEGNSASIPFQMGY